MLELKKLKILMSLLVCLIAFSSCDKGPLPFLGERDLDGSLYKVPTFSFVNQDSVVVNTDYVEDKVYIVDFFFTKCPTICPMVKGNVLKIYEHYKNNENFLILSHSIDTKNDSIPVLKDYAQKLGVEEGGIWHFLTGNKFEIYEMANKYFISALESEQAPGGFDHSGKVILVDSNGHIRSFFDGTEADEVPRFIKDIQRILNEQQ